MALTDTWLRLNSGKPQPSVTEKADREGLSVRTSLKGKMTFQLRFRFANKHQRVDIGTYPLISLKEARDKAQRFRAELEQGIDPRIIKRTEKLKNIETATLSDLFYRWYETYCVDHKIIHHDIKRSFEIHILPEFGPLPPDRVSVDQWLTLLEKVRKTTPAIAERLLINIKQLMSWASRRKLIESNTLATISAKRDLNIQKKPGSRFLAEDELVLFLLALDRTRIARKNKLFLLLCLIYGCRNGELRKAKKVHFNFEQMIWTIPAENHKSGKATGKPLIRPITDDTALLIKECMRLSPTSKYIITNAGSNEPMGTAAPLSLPKNIRQWLRRHQGVEMQHWSIHDLRKTARTNFSTLTQPHIAELMLGHKLPGEWQTYDQHQYLAEQTECLIKWVARLKTLTSKSRLTSVAVGQDDGLTHGISDNVVLIKLNHPNTGDPF
jgi:integrase